MYQFSRSYRAQFILTLFLANSSDFQFLIYLCNTFKLYIYSVFFEKERGATTVGPFFGIG